MEYALEVRGLRKVYGSFTLDPVTFSLPAGGIMGFVGQNGAGKTTTIRLILNMASRDGGEVKVFGSDNLKDEREVKQQIAAVFDEIFFVDSWKVGGVERAIGGFYDKWDSAAYAAYLKRFELPRERRIKELSRGMKMKLMLAVAMSHGARLLILDEPTSGLDPVARDELLDILREYVAGGERSVLFSTHITSDLERVAGYITLIDHGRVFYTGEKDGLLDHFRVISGQKSELADDLRRKLIGLSLTASGFSGMLRAADASGLPGGLAVKEPDIDEVLIYISKEAHSHE